MDKASDYGSGDSRFESWQGRHFIFSPEIFLCCIFTVPFAFVSRLTPVFFAHIYYLKAYYPTEFHNVNGDLTLEAEENWSKDF